MKIITAAAAWQNTKKNFKKVQRLFMKELKRISKNGNSSATFNPKEYQEHVDKLITWIEGLGFVCKKETEDCIRIIW